MICYSERCADIVKLFWVQFATMDTDTCQGGKCFGTKSADNERENEVAVVVCCRCSLKSDMLLGA